MTIYDNPTKMKDWLFEDAINTQASVFLESESNTYVVFDGTAKILCEGTLDECYVYQVEYKKSVGFSPTIYAKEAYENMMKKGKKSYDGERH